MISEPLGAAAEAYRLLRTNIEFMTLDSKAKSILVTSALEQEGKTTTIVNLAVAFAQTGKSVVLVDLDLRRPRVHQLLQTPQVPGLTDLLKDPSRLDEVLVEFDDRRVFGDSDLGDSRGRLQVLPSGFIPPNPGELVASPRLLELLNQLSLRADIVLIDSPPMLHVGDAAAMTNSVDAMFIVARMPKLRRRMLGEMKRMLATVRAQHLGVVASAVEHGDDYSYGYGYGYGQEAAAKDPRINGSRGAASSDRVRTSAPE
jgi:polysaccharide biosynthesis transport protein